MIRRHALVFLIVKVGLEGLRFTVHSLLVGIGWPPVTSVMLSALLSPRKADESDDQIYDYKEELERS